MISLPSASSCRVVASSFFLFITTGCGGGTSEDSSEPRDPEVECTEDSECSNDIFCDGEERCEDSLCVQGEPVNCDDEIECTTDSCNEVDLRCEHVAPDFDQDGERDANCRDADGNSLGTDCDDDDDQRYSKNVEVCVPGGESAERDEDCDPTTVGFFDFDGDGATSSACCNSSDVGHVLCGADCDDKNLVVFSGQPEFCDGIDNDCNDKIDEVENRIPWYVDADEDGFGSGEDVLISCAPVPGRSHLGTDCDDTNPEINRANPEICNGLDDNCNGFTDEGLKNCDSAEVVPTSPVNECLENDTCNLDGEFCVDQAIGYDCSCLPGFRQSAEGCVDIEDCKSPDGAGCAETATCTEVIGAPSVCTCPVGYGSEDLGKTCQDIDECTQQNGGCGAGVECTNTEGSRLCGDCPEFSTGDGITCTDINECLVNNGGCGDAAFYKCTNRIGKAQLCADINECLTDNGGCGAFATCQNSIGGFSCPDINECLTNNGGCGSATYYSCADQTGGPPVCADIDECVGVTRTCDPLVSCVNRVGAAPTCGACPANYVGNGTTGCSPRLTSLALSSGTLSPALAAATTSYTIFVGLTVESITLTPSVPAGATVTLQDVAVTPGQPSQAVSLNLGANNLTLEVSQVGQPTRTYNLVVTRGMQEAYIKASNTQSNDNFGTAVAISGSYMVVGAPGEAGNGSAESNNSAGSAGAAYVFIRSAQGVWTQQAYLKASNPGLGDNFGQSVAIVGATIVVGAPGEDSNATGVDGAQDNDLSSNSGAAYVFTRSGTIWTQQEYLKGTYSRAGDAFGTSVAVNSNRALIGATGDDSASVGVDIPPALWNRSGSGAAYIFSRSNGDWSPQAYLKASGSISENEYFGNSVALSGPVAVVGGHRRSQELVRAGTAEVFRLTGSTWAFEQELKASNSDFNDYFGTSVAIDGETIAVGALGEESSATGVNGNSSLNGTSSAGAVYVFSLVEGSWDEVAYVKPIRAQGSGYASVFGSSVALHNNVLVVGAPGERNGGSGLDPATTGRADDSGAIYVYARTGAAPGVWAGQAYIKASNAEAADSFGTSVGISGASIVTGAKFESSDALGINGDQPNNNAAASGAVYTFR